MMIKFRFALIVRLLSLFSTSIFMSCDVQEVSINLVKVVPLDPETCNTVSTDSGSPVTSGAFDLVLGTSYSINLSASNALINVVAAKGFNEQDGRVNTNHINLTRLLVEYVDADGVDLGLDPIVDIPLTGQLSTDDPQALTIPNIVVFSTQMTEILEQNGLLRGNGVTGPIAIRGSFTVILRLTLFGETVDQRKVQSNQISFPVEVCNGCRVSGSCTDRPLTDDEQERLLVCPVAIGKDSEFASCELCKEFAKPELAQLCDP